MSLSAFMRWIAPWNDATVRPCNLKLFVVDSISSKQILLVLSRLASKQIVPQSILVACILFNIYQNALMRYHLLETTKSASKLIFQKFDGTLQLRTHHILLNIVALSWICWCSLMNFIKSLFACPSFPPSWCEIVCVPIKIHIAPSDC